MIQERLRGLLAEAIEELRRDGVIPDGVTAPAELQRPARPEHGDFSTNVALALSGKLGTPPRALADRIVQALPDADWVAKVTVAGPGFINFVLTHAWGWRGIAQDFNPGIAIPPSPHGSDVGFLMASLAEYREALQSVFGRRRKLDRRGPEPRADRLPLLCSRAFAKRRRP